MSLLGIYFGIRTISVVEAKGKKIVNNITVPRSALSSGELEEKVPDEIKIVTLLKDEMRRNKIEAKDVFLCLSGKDLIVRTFEIPVLPQDELSNAVTYEAKKYIPFKVEELVSDFQVQLDKVSHRNLVLFVGIKKEILDKYLSILSQLELKVNAIEYSAFSILRFMQLTGVGNKGIVGIISTDFQEEDEVHFTILENGFPLFSRDITLLGRPEELSITERPQPAMLLEKLKTEIRISLDYYDRKLPTKNIENTFLICPQEYRSVLEASIKEMSLPVNFIDASKYLGWPGPFSLSLIKAYGCSLAKILKTRLKIDLLLAKTKARVEKEVTQVAERFAFLARLKISPWSAILGLLILSGTFAYGQYRLLPLKKDLNYILSARPKIDSVNPDSTYQDLQGIDFDYRKKIELMDSLVRKQLYLTEQLDVVPRAIPEGIWLTDYSFRKEQNSPELSLRGVAYLEDSDKEVKLVNTFLSNLKENTSFTKNFKDINIISVERGEIDMMAVTNFTITCRGYSEKE